MSERYVCRFARGRYLIVVQDRETEPRFVGPPSRGGFDGGSRGGYQDRGGYGGGHHGGGMQQGGGGGGGRQLYISNVCLNLFDLNFILTVYSFLSTLAGKI